MWFGRQKVVGFDALKAGIDALVCLRHEGGWNLARAPNSTSNLRLYSPYRFFAFNTFTIKSTYFVLKDKGSLQRSETTLD
jgi:hypothetical protein